LLKVQAAIRNWRGEANRLHIPRAEQDLMTPVFEP
jgi:hypothetical protein